MTQPLARPKHAVRWLAATLCLLGVAAISLGGERPTRAEIGKRGKAATALVLNGSSSGSAFCVHPSGLFVTNEHVIKSAAGDRVKLVLDSALKTQLVLDAKVVRRDAAHDLALLQVEGKDLPKAFPTLPLGNSDNVAELASLYAFGFPFGTALGTGQGDKKDYPSISINVCTVSALRHKAGELDRIDLNGAVNPGQSGGPMIDEDGKVVGVIVSGIRGSGIAQAIPSARLARFLERPEITFTAPRLDAAAAAKPVTFKVRVDSLVPSDKAPEVDVIVSTEGASRRQKMELRDGLYQTELTPAPPPKGPRPIELAIRFVGGTTIVTPVTDRSIKVGGTSVALKDLARIRFADGGQAKRLDGTMLTGPIDGLDAVAVQVGGQPVTLDLRKADSIEISQKSDVPAITLEFVVSLKGKEVGRTTATVPIGSAAAAAVTSPPVVIGALQPPELGAEKLVKRLPGTFADVAVGGNGRYLIFSLPQQRKLAIFDVSAARVAGFIPVDDDDVKFAAGLGKLVVALPSKGLLQRWDLETRERELTVQSGGGTVRHVAMGHASAGPVLVHSKGRQGPRGEQTEFLDLKTLKPIALRDVAGRNDINVETDGFVRASADGQTFGFWRTNTSPQGISSLVIQGNDVRRSYDHHSAGHVSPSPDGKTLYTARGRYTVDVKSLDDPRNGHNYRNYLIPSVHGNYYLGVELGSEGKALNVILAGDKRPLTQTNPNVRDNLPEEEGWDREAIGFYKRIYLIPEAKVIVTLPKTNDEIVLHRFDVEESLEKSGIDYLLITSTPPATARKGAAFRYQITAKAKKGGVTFKLDSGPEGLKVSPDGVVTWNVPEDAEPTANVIVTVRDRAGQETFHTFALKLE